MKKNYLLLALVAILSVFGLSSCTNEDVDESLEQQGTERMVTRYAVIKIPPTWTEIARNVKYDEGSYVSSVVSRNWYCPEYKGTDTKESITAEIGDDAYSVYPFGQRVVNYYAEGIQYLTPEGTTVYITTELVIDFNPIIHNGGEVR